MITGTAIFEFHFSLEKPLGNIKIFKNLLLEAATIPCLSGRSLESHQLQRTACLQERKVRFGSLSDVLTLVFSSSMITMRISPPGG